MVKDMADARNVETELFRRSLAALAGVAVGDALGKMTEGYWPPEIESRYGGKVETFLSPQQPRSTHAWAFAEVTDDTRFTILVAESIVACGGAGDADSIAAMAGGIVTARHPDTLPAEWVAIVKRENNLALEPLAERLVALRK